MNTTEIGTCIIPLRCQETMLNFVVPTYNGGHKLDVIINCLLSQSSVNWSLTVVSDGPDDVTEKQMNRYDQHNNISYHHTNIRHNDWGHTPREYGMLLSKDLFTVMTGYDNYYVPLFVEIFENHIQPDVDFIYCDFLLDHAQFGVKYQNYKNSQLRAGDIDIGNFATRTTLIQEIGYTSRAFAADWDVIQQLVPKISERGTRIVKIPQTLYVHN